MSEVAEPQAERRRTSAVLSLMAACSTLGLFAWSFVIHLRGSNDSAPVRAWLVIISLPAIAVSASAAAQYRWGRHSGAGAAAAVVLWVLVLLFNLRAGVAYFPAAVLQTVAWFISRPR
jgi:hypothetical protein